MQSGAIHRGQLGFELFDLLFRERRLPEVCLARDDLLYDSSLLPDGLRRFLRFMIDAGRLYNSLDIIVAEAPRQQDHILVLGLPLLGLQQVVEVFAVVELIALLLNRIQFLRSHGMWASEVLLDFRLLVPCVLRLRDANHMPVALLVDAMQVLDHHEWVLVVQERRGPLANIPGLDATSGTGDFDGSWWIEQRHRGQREGGRVGRRRVGRRRQPISIGVLAHRGD